MNGQSREVIDTIRERTDIEELVGSYLPLKRAGSHLKALCPFHEEKTPSFTVNPERQIFKCFGCGEGGDAFSFVMKMERVGFPEAMQVLAERAGVRLEEKGPSESEGPSKALLRRATHWAFEWYRARYLGQEGQSSRDYVASRGISEAMAESFGFGHSPGGGTALVRAARQVGVPEKVLEAAGLAARRSDGELRDRFWDARVMFPIRDVLGRVVAFGGRTLDGSEPKYLNSPEGPLFHKGKLLFGLERLKAWRDRPVLVVEGYTDVVMAEEVGSGGLVATLGTALTPDHAKLLRRHASELILVYDGDQAGLDAAYRGSQILLQAGHLDLRVAVLPAGKDPCDYFQGHGAAAREQIEGEARELVDFLIDRTIEQSGGDGVAARQRAASEFARLLVGLDPISRELVASKVASRIGVSAHAIESGATAPRRRRFEREESAEPTERLSPRHRGLRQAQEDALRAAVNHPGLLVSHGERMLGLFPEGEARQLLVALRDEQARGAAQSAALIAALSDERLRALAESLLLLEADAGLEGQLEDALKRLQRHRWEQDKTQARAELEAGAHDDLRELQERLRRLKAPTRQGTRAGEPDGAPQGPSE